jgi:hypothetical protein
MVDDFLVCFEALETIDGTNTKEKISELKNLPRTVSSCVDLIEKKPEWFEVSYFNEVKNEDSSTNDENNQNNN